MDKGVNLKIAKLLKRKGLRLNHCKELFYRNPNNTNEFIPLEMSHDWEIIEGREWYSRPTTSETIMWIYREHGIWISVSVDSVFNRGKFWISVFMKQAQDHLELLTIGNMHSPYNSPDEAYEAAIEYVLKKLIRKK